VLSGHERVNGTLRVARGGLIYRDSDKTWTHLELPFSGPLMNAGAVWTGKQLLVVGAPCAEPFPAIEGSEVMCPDTAVEAASFSPTDNKWELLPPPGKIGELAPGPPFVRGLGWTGQHAVFQFQAPRSLTRVALFDPQDGRWAALPGSEDAAKTSCVLDGSVVRVGLPGEDAGGSGQVWGSAEGTISTERYDLERDDWNRLADHPLGDAKQIFSLVRCQDGEAVILKAHGVAGAQELLWFNHDTDAWEELPAIAEPFTDVTPARLGETRVLWTSDLARNYYLLDQGATEWRATPKPSTTEAEVEVIGDELLVQVGITAKDLSLLDPKAYADANGAPG
jgi:hypothetical protein